MPNPVGRPPKLNDKIAHDIELAIRAGNYVEVAAQFGGIAKDTLYRWLKTGANARTKPAERRSQHERRCVALSDGVARAMADSEAESTGRIVKAGTNMQTKRTTKTTTDAQGNVTTVETEEEVPPDWRALAWHQERRFSRRWGQRNSLQLSGPEGSPIPVDARVAQVAQKVRQLKGLTDPDVVVDAPDDEATTLLGS